MLWHTLLQMLASVVVLAQLTARQEQSRKDLLITKLIPMHAWIAELVLPLVLQAQSRTNFARVHLNNQMIYT